MTSSSGPRRESADTRWSGRCWLIHDQPVIYTPAQPRYVKNVEQVWWEHYAKLVEYMRAGEFPPQNDGAEGQKLYRWLGAQRGTHEDWWLQRLDAVRQFQTEAGCLPHTDRRCHPDEAYRCTSLVNQRILHRKGRLRPGRRERLGQDLPGWFE